MAHCEAERGGVMARAVVVSVEVYHGRVEPSGDFGFCVSALFEKGAGEGEGGGKSEGERVERR